MTLKEELEILRGEPIKVYDGDPMDIPCIETSDPERLCKHPVVSVHMITYNHEPYIRQAIEGVMMQKTDFEFELIIGEDASQDKTREICFEYQKKYPDKIRVLWWHENVSKLGGNGRRVSARCRGEYIAFCEGDDYWIDPLKLQKQVDVMRKYPNVGFCFCGATRYYQKEDRYDDWNEGEISYKPGVQEKEKFFATFMYGFGPGDPRSRFTGFIMTASTMSRRSLVDSIKGKYDVFKWRLWLGDATLWLGCSAEMDGYYIPDQVSVYRISDHGVFQNQATQKKVRVDGVLVRLYYLIAVWKLNATDCPSHLLYSLNCMVVGGKSYWEKIAYAWRQLRLRELFASQWRWYMLPFWMCLMTGLCFFPFENLVRRFAYYGVRLNRHWSVGLKEKCREAGVV